MRFRESRGPARRIILQDGVWEAVMKIEVLLGFKSGNEQRTTFEVELPKQEGEGQEGVRKAFAKIARMIMHKDMRRGFINTGSFAFRVEDVSYVKHVY
jgi:hypothetical protein